MTDWADLMRALQVDVGNAKSSYSLIDGRVLGVDTESESIFAVDVRSDSSDPNPTRRLAEALFDGSTDVVLCYCSVYDECWIARLQDIMKRSRESEVVDDEAKHVDCTSVPQSAI